MRRTLAWLVMGVMVAGIARGDSLAYAPAPPDNPLKGFVPYAGQGGKFPHSLEFDYLPLRDLMTGPDTFTWQPLDDLLDEIAGRGCQAVVRVYLEYPRKPTGVPKFLVDGGVNLTTWINNEEKPPARIQTPNYEDPQLRKALAQFIKAFGERYDDDPRLAYVQAGLLGVWGEWHDYPREDLFASKTVQQEVLDAYASAFRKTPVLLRYPAGDDDSTYASTANLPFGYHDDSFAWGTLDTGRQDDSWFYMALLKKAGPAAQNRWRTHPIGGEIRPELWRCLWSEDGCAEGQDYARCVAETHATWLMESSTNRKLDAASRQRAINAARSLGYEFHVAEADVAFDPDRRTLRAAITIKNLGVAPFYRDWPLQLRVVDASGKAVETWTLKSTLQNILPGEAPEVMTLADRELNLAEGRYKVLLGVANPMPGGKPVKFANKAQDADSPGWLTLGEIVKSQGQER